MLPQRGGRGGRGSALWSVERFQNSRRLIPSLRALHTHASHAFSASIVFYEVGLDLLLLADASIASGELCADSGLAVSITYPNLLPTPLTLEHYRGFLRLGRYRCLTAVYFFFSNRVSSVKPSVPRIRPRAQDTVAPDHTT